MDYIGEVGFNALHKPKVTSSFATLDVNRDGKIDKSDSDATSDSKIKNERPPTRIVVNRLEGAFVLRKSVLSFS